MLQRLMMVLALTGAFHQPVTAAEPVVDRSVRRVTLTVGNMSCAMCKYTVENALMRVEGVRSAEVDMDRAIAVVTYDPARVRIDALVKAVSDAGYPAVVEAQEGSRLN